MADKSDGTMAEWLDLHGITAELCRAMLDAAPSPTPAAAKPKDAELQLSPGEVLEKATGVLVSSLPDEAHASAQEQLQQVRIVVDPERVEKLSGALRPLTVEDSGDGHPAVLCPYRNRLRDGLALAHEIAHALQYARASQFVPPVLREMFAFLGEHALIEVFETEDHPQAENARVHWEDQDRIFLVTHGDLLRAALDTADAAYDYRWNYALARALIGRVLAPDAAQLRLRLADGPSSLPALLD